MNTYQQHAPSPQAPLSAAPFHFWAGPSGKVIAQFYRMSGGFMLRFVGRADFSIDLDQRALSCVPVPGASPEMVRALYLNQVTPLLLGHDGALVLHAAAIDASGPGLRGGFRPRQVDPRGRICRGRVSIPHR